tara:strand:- start:111 stop:299 length:189 start_codon:yes stop_codon:yes gene_type:complete
LGIEPISPILFLPHILIFINCGMRVLPPYHPDMHWVAHGQYRERAEEKRMRIVKKNENCEEE